MPPKKKGGRRKAGGGKGGGGKGNSNKGNKGKSSQQQQPSRPDQNGVGKESLSPLARRVSRVTLELYKGEAQLPLFLPLIAADLSEPYNIYTYRYFLHGWPSLCFLAYDDAPQGELLEGFQAVKSGKVGGGAGGDQNPKVAQMGQKEQESALGSGSHQRGEGAGAGAGGSPQLLDLDDNDAGAATTAKTSTTKDAGDTDVDGIGGGGGGDGADWPAWGDGGDVEPVDERGRRCVGSVIAKMDRHKRGPLRGYIAMLAVHPAYRKCGLATKLVERCILAMEEQLCEEVVLETEVTNLGALALYQSLGFLREKRLMRYYLNGNDAFRLRMCLMQEQDRQNYAMEEAQRDMQHAEEEAREKAAEEARREEARKRLREKLARKGSRKK